ncbi:MAG: DUF4240 domain-containing protein [Armatimonadetes bacterium]|nr:DUF4240 domain-containing protein [Armatimonadota bacterium]
MRREFCYQDDRSNKFWTIEREGTTVLTTWGRIGARAREARKEYPSEDDAQRAHDRLVAAKLREGYVERAIADVPARARADWAAVTMSEEVFWRIIRLFNWKKSGDDDSVIEPAVVALAQMGSESIKRFQDILTEKLHALDTEAHARQIGEGAYGSEEHFSVDWFLYVRCCVVANGREFYDRVLADPSQMPEEREFEALLYVAPTAYERKTGLDFDHDAPLSYETFSNRAGWAGAPSVD